MNTSVLVVLILVTHLTFITSDRSDEFQKYFKDDQNSKVFRIRPMRVDDIPGKCESKEKCEVISGVNVCSTVSTCTK